MAMQESKDQEPDEEDELLRQAIEMSKQGISSNNVY